jgi:alternate signal-mediated exported protein
MQKSAKGAIAAVAAAFLLVGGGGSLAYWTSTQDVTGGIINSGHMNITTDATNTGCGDWTLDSVVSGPAYVPEDPLVPGDVLSKICNYTIEASGNHLQATVEASAPDVIGALADALDVAATDIEVNGAPASIFTEANDGQTLSLTVTVTFASGSDNLTQDLAAVLDDITITATQVHA